MSVKREIQKSGHIRWINCAKGVAIIAVLVDHTFGMLYVDTRIQTATLFSVSLFILLSGMTSYMSDERHVEGWLQNYIRNTKKLVIAYLIAVAIYQIYLTKGFGLSEYLGYIVHFDISTPHYFVLLYLQLMLANKPLYELLQKFKKSNYEIPLEALLFLIIVLFVISTRHIRIIKAYGGAKRILGGSFLILYYLGMLISKHGWLDITDKKKSILMTMAGSAGFVSWLFVLIQIGNKAIDKHFPFGKGINPPSVSVTILSLAMLLLTAGLFSLMDNYKGLRLVVDAFDWLGNYTLYIFIYHELFWKLLLQYGAVLNPWQNVWIGRIICYAGMILCPAIMNIVIDRVLGLPKKARAYMKTREENA